MVTSFHQGRNSNVKIDSWGNGFLDDPPTYIHISHGTMALGPVGNRIWTNLMGIRNTYVKMINFQTASFSTKRAFFGDPEVGSVKNSLMLVMVDESIFKW